MPLASAVADYYWKAELAWSGVRAALGENDNALVAGQGGWLSEASFSRFFEPQKVLEIFFSIILDFIPPRLI
jgi:hypothetical protein